MDTNKAKEALELIVDWFSVPQPTTAEQDANLTKGLKIARELLGKS